MRYGFIQPHIMITDEWYIIDTTGLVYHKGGDNTDGTYIMVGNILPDYWIESCKYWYNSLEELCAEHSIEML